MPGGAVPAGGGHSSLGGGGRASLAPDSSQLRGSRQAMSLAHKGTFGRARLGVRERIWGAASAQMMPGACVGIC